MNCSAHQHQRSLTSIWARLLRTGTVLTVLALGAEAVLAHDGAPPAPSHSWDGWNWDPTILIYLLAAVGLFVAWFRALEQAMHRKERRSQTHLFGRTAEIAGAHGRESAYPERTWTGSYGKES